jgi:hypothetical protein
MCSGSNASYPLGNLRTISRVSPVHDQLETPEQVSRIPTIRNNTGTVRLYDDL